MSSSKGVPKIIGGYGRGLYFQRHEGFSVDFSKVVVEQIKAPLDALCAGLMAAGELDQYLFFNGVAEMMGDGTDEGSVMMGCIELGRCAFLGFQFTPDVELQVSIILDRAIELSSIMSADSMQ